ncbi:MAG: hypothetical protein Q4C96_09870 [Planctomycetia bacterium]|nr:hypothetical protein [Planctomycetia bacterium]
MKHLFTSYRFHTKVPFPVHQADGIPAVRNTGKTKFYRVSGLAWMIATFCIMFFTAAQADDQIKRHSEERSFAANVIRTTPDEITINRSGMESTVPVGDIEFITYENEPTQLREGRRSINSGQNEDARDTLLKLKDDMISRNDIKMERDFFIALANTNIAYQGGDVSLAKAIDGLEKFIKDHPKSYRYYEALQLLGDLYLQTKETKKADTAFTRLSKVESSPTIRAHGCLGKGRVLLTRGKAGATEAQKMYNEVQKTINAGEISGKMKDMMQLNVTLGLARCAAYQEKYAEAQKMAQQVIDSVPPEDNQMNALAFNTLGDALKRSGKPRDAIVAYLHTHLLYNLDPVLHTEALTELINLCRSTGDTLKARELEGIQLERYKR